MSREPIRIGNASGFYGDRLSAMREMLEGGELDVLSGDYLAELTMLILARDRAKDPDSGYARTFLRQMEDTLGPALDRGVAIVTNAGGLNPAGLAEALRTLAARLGLRARVAHVEGDDLRSRAAELGLGAPLAANAYLGGWGIAACLQAGADVVVTGRVTDASLVVGPAAAHFGWSPTDYDQLAGAVAAGHVIECGTQATGGNFSFFTEIPDLRHPGFPVAEVAADGSSVITKHEGTGGVVTVETVTAQLLYEVGGSRYAGPDVTLRLDSVRLEQDGRDRVRISGVRGEAPPPHLKVSLNSLGGFRNEVTFVLTGLDIEAKARLVRDQLAGAVPADTVWTLARTDHDDADDEERASAFLHCVARGADPAKVGRAFSSAAVEIALGTYPGAHLTAPPGEASPYGVFTAGYVPVGEVHHVAVLPDGERIEVAPGPGAATPTDAREPDAPEPDVPGPDVPGPDVPGPDVPGPDVPDVPVPDVPEPDATQPDVTQPDVTQPDVPAWAGGGPTRRAPLGLVAGARSGDKGGSANLGIWSRTDQGWPWLAHMLTVDRLQELLPETKGLAVFRYLLPNLRAVNFVIEGLLGEGVAYNARFDPQAKALGEWLRSRLVEIPEELVP